MWTFRIFLMCAIFYPSFLFAGYKKTMQKGKEISIREVCNSFSSFRPDFGSQASEICQAFLNKDENPELPIEILES